MAPRGASGAMASATAPACAEVLCEAHCVAPCFEVRLGGTRGRAVFATRPVACGEVVLEDTPFLVCEAEEELGAQWARNAASFTAASPSRRQEVLALLPSGVDESHRIARLAASFAAQRAAADGTAVIEELKNAILAFHLTSYELDCDESLLGLFALVSKFNHSCDANAKGALRPPASGPSRVYAVRDIAVGEEITLCYLTVAERLKHRESRRDHLYAHKMFVCDCSTCSAGSDLLRKVPCPDCQPRAKGRLSDNQDDRNVSYASRDIGSSLWACHRCAGSWTPIAFVDACQQHPSDEERICTAVGRHFIELEGDYSYGAPAHEEWHGLRREVLSVLGARHWTAILLDMCRLDHLAVDLQGFIRAGLHRDPALPLSVVSALAEYEHTVCFVFDRLASALEGGGGAVLLMWQDLWNAGSLLGAFGSLETALRLLKLVEPLLVRCAHVLLAPLGAGGVSVEAGLAALEAQLLRCQRLAEGRGPPVLVLFRAPYFEGDGVEWLPDCVAVSD